MEQFMDLIGGINVSYVGAILGLIRYQNYLLRL